MTYFCMKRYVVDPCKKCLSEALLMSTHNMCSCRNKKNNICGYLLLSGAMVFKNTLFVAQVLLWNQFKTEIYAKENIWLTFALYMFKIQRETVINLVPLERELNFLKTLHWH